MKQKKVVGTLQLVPPSNTKSAVLHIHDKASGLKFASIELDPGALESLLWGEQVNGTLTAYAVGRYLGYRKVTQSRTVPYPGSVADDISTITNWVQTRAEPEWTPEPNVRPSDIYLIGGQLHITYNVSKYVKP